MFKYEHRIVKIGAKFQLQSRRNTFWSSWTTVGWIGLTDSIHLVEFNSIEELMKRCRAFFKQNEIIPVIDAVTVI